jgi:hypothetical protein
VLDREWLSVHGADHSRRPVLDALRMNEFTDKYAKLIFADPGRPGTPDPSPDECAPRAPLRGWPA